MMIKFAKKSKDNPSKSSKELKDTKSKTSNSEFEDFDINIDGVTPETGKKRVGKVLLSVIGFIVAILIVLFATSFLRGLKEEVTVVGTNNAEFENNIVGENEDYEEKLDVVEYEDEIIQVEDIFTEEHIEKVQDEAVLNIPEKVYQAPSGYVGYLNGFLRLKFVYPEKWFIKEKTHLYLSELNEVQESGLSVKEHGLTSEIEIAELKSPKEQVTLTVGVYPFNVNILKLDQVLVKEANSKDIDGLSVTDVRYTVEEYGEEFSIIQYILKYGANQFVLTAKLTDDVDEEGFIEVMNKIALSVEEVSLEESESLRGQDEGEVQVGQSLETDEGTTDED